MPRAGQHAPTTAGGGWDHREAAPTALFFQYNTALGPPYQVLIDTNFINFSIRNKVNLPSQAPRSQHGTSRVGGVNQIISAAAGRSPIPR